MSLSEHPTPDAPVNATALSLLGFLQWGPQSGWELAQAVEHSIGNFWNVTRSQVYRELRNLESRGLVEAGEVGQRDRRPYTITDAGRAVFAEQIADEPSGELVRIPMLLTMFFGRQVEPARLRRYLEAWRVEHRRKLDQYEQLLPEMEGDSYIASTVRFGIGYETTVLRWLDDELARLGSD